MFEINRNFRNEGISTIHNPEFTMLEFYQAYADYHDLMALTEEMFIHLAKEVCGTTSLQYQNETIDFTPPWRRMAYLDSIVEVNGLNPEILTNFDQAIGRRQTIAISRSTQLPGSFRFLFNSLRPPLSQR